MTTKKMAEFIGKVIDENHGESVLILDVQKLSSIADYIIICSANSERHLKALAEHIISEVKTKFAVRALNNNSSNQTDWKLVDFGDIIVHIMLPHSRTFYELEKLWSKMPTTKKAKIPIKKSKKRVRKHPIK